MKKSALLMILLTWFLGNMDVHFITPSLPALAASFSVDATKAQLIISSFLLGKALSMLFWGIISQYYGRKTILIGGLVLFICSNLIASWSTTIGFLIVCRFFQGMGVGATLLMGRAMINDTQNERNATRYFAWLFTLGGVFICFLPLFGGLLNSYWNWRIALLVIAAYGLFLLPLGGFLRETKLHNERPVALKKILFMVFSHPVFVGYLMISALMMAGESAFNTSASFILIKGAHYSVSEYGFIKTTMAVMHLLGTACCGFMATYYSGTQLVGFGVRLFVLSVWCMGLFAIIFDSILFYFIVPMMIYYFGTGFIVASAAASSVRPFPKHMTMALALTLFCQFNCSALFSLITSLIGVERVDAFLVLLALISLLSFIFMQRLKVNAHVCEFTSGQKVCVKQTG
ncbi:MFS transporter [Legionella worsleiensis]|uniref:Drug resistance transporter, Bcr/CflA n=1 Tax=Legionella worsleiensis TaxID=45076 RepID=A0A0W1AAB2_9GAMM|nr:MFS transporter [Legionella worsleiensis]KTD78287.1 drug resistance transporter, Bcr/CflA [Legionella worsleiensis]STY32624.1 drug resistance transporter, Bcr/CflA [Legionella worsleiensis]